MCDLHPATDLSRRRFGGMMMGAAGLALVPFGARAKAIDSLAVMCIDYRLVQAYVGFFFDGEDGPGKKNYDLVSLAGASLAAGSKGLFARTVDVFYQQVGAAWLLHTIKDVIFVDHMGCGAYREEFNGGKPVRAQGTRAPLPSPGDARGRRRLPQADRQAGPAEAGPRILAVQGPPPTARWAIRSGFGFEGRCRRPKPSSPGEARAHRA